MMQNTEYFGLYRYSNIRCDVTPTSRMFTVRDIHFIQNRKLLIQRDSTQKSALGTISKQYIGTISKLFEIHIITFIVWVNKRIAIRLDDPVIRKKGERALGLLLWTELKVVRGQFFLY